MNHFKSLLLSLAVVSSCTEAEFSFVWPEGTREEMNTTMAFQLDRQLPSGEATLEICASNGYMVFQNDEMIAFGPARTAHGYIRKDEIRLSGIDGDTKITIDVIGNNINSFCYPNEKPYFAAKVICDGRAVAGTKDFSCFRLSDRVQKVERFSYQRDFVEAYRMKRDRSCFYKGDRSMFEKHSVSQVEKPKILSRNAPYPKYGRVPMDLVENGDVTFDGSRPVWDPRFIKRISDTTSKGYRREDLEICISDSLSKLVYAKRGKGLKEIKKGSYSVFDAGRTITGWVDMKLKVTEPARFYVLFDEIDFHEEKQPEEGINVKYNRNNCVGAMMYELEPGDYHLVNFEQFSARFLKLVCVKGSATVDEALLIAFENPDMFRLEFKCEDDSLNSIIRAAQNTLAQNAVDLFTDCPQRERAGWLCDAFFSAKAEFLLTGDNVIDRCFLENYALAPQLPQLPEGMVPMCYPGDHISGEYIANWSMWYVLQLYDYFKRTGDKQMVKMSKGKVEGLLKYFENFESEEGFLENLDGWVFVEWSDANNFTDGINFPTNMVYSEMLVSIGELYGRTELVEKGNLLKKKIADISFNGKFFEDNILREDGEIVRTGNISETCQYYAFFFGIADENSHPELYRTMFTEFGLGRDETKEYPEVKKSNAFIGNYLRLEVLRRDHRTAQMLRECKQFFYYMANRTGTLWEHAKVSSSLNHGFASYAANFIIEAVTGISGYDVSTGKYSLSEPGIRIDCDAVLPFKGDSIIVSFHGDDRKYE